MIVCHQHRYIFIKTRKTAGTSVEIGLSKFCGPTDIITMHDAEDEAIRRSLGYPGPQNEYSIGFRHYRPADWRRFLLRRQRARFKNHMTAERIRSLVGKDVWDRYYKFCVERDPWDKALSLYFWRTSEQDEPRPELLDFLKSTKRNSLSNFRIYSIAGRVAVDRVLRYESLERDLDEVRSHLGIPEPVVLPRAKGKTRPRDAGPTKLIGPSEKSVIDRVCAREIALFGYSFSGATGSA